MRWTGKRARLRDELRRRETAYQKAVSRAEELRRQRNAVVHAAADTLTHKQIAAITGLSRGRVGQIVGGETR